MTDKQIIIDGVEVQDCCYFDYENDGYEDSCYMYDNECSANCNCYYKQLKRKEQECEELKKDLRRSFKEKDTLHLIIDRLLEASGYDINTASEEDFEDVYEHMRCEQQQLDQLKAENDRLKEELDFLKNNIYREALKKIREYINDNTDFDKGDYFQSKTAAYDILRILALYGE